MDEALILCDRIYVITGQPGLITYELTVDLKNEHAEERIFEPAFLEAKKKLLLALEK